MKEEQIKSAFIKAKQDIVFLEKEISILKLEFFELKKILKEILDNQNTQKLHEINKNILKKQQFNNSTLRQINSTHPVTSTDTSTVPQEIEGLKSPNLSISTGNEGVSTDRQTLRQTDNYTQNEGISPISSLDSDLQKASNILDSLDALKKEIRFKFKRITSQEMAVFSAIYQLEEQNKQPTNYHEIALKLNLSESSIRDYVQRMINKGIPIKKQKINNKKIILSISTELKRIATLNTIIQLREL